MSIIERYVEGPALILAKSCGGNPVLTTVVVMLFFIMFNVFLASVERLIFGERFEHWLDPIFGAIFIAYAAYGVWACAVFNTNSKP